jgi:hypothetical protein
VGDLQGDICAGPAGKGGGIGPVDGIRSPGYKDLGEDAGGEMGGIVVAAKMSPLWAST